MCVPITLVILSMLFSVQRFGTGSVAIVFGPVTAVWFLAHRRRRACRTSSTDPDVLLAVNPYHAVDFSVRPPGTFAFGTIGAVFLAVTGAEALYVDLGHFGRRPIVLAWICDRVSRACCSTISARAPLCSRTTASPQNPFFEMLPGLGAAADGAAGDRGDRHRQPGGDLGRLFADPPGGAAEHSAAHRDPAHVGDSSPARSTCRASTCCCCIGVMLLVVGFGDVEHRWPRPTASRSPARCW